MPYKDNDKKRRYQKNWCKRKRKILVDIVWKHKDKACADCGVKYPPWIMDFDHVRGKKVANVSKLAMSSSVEKILIEIEKCEVVCANCHRNREYFRKKKP